MNQVNNSQKTIIIMKQKGVALRWGVNDFYLLMK